jgi:hypothetical protein
MILLNKRLILNDQQTYICNAKFQINNIEYIIMFTHSKLHDTYTLHFNLDNQWTLSELNNDYEIEIYNYMKGECKNETTWMA